MTRRQDIIKLLSQQSMTVRELAEWFHTDARDILIDLEHIAQSVRPARLVMEPSTCRGCGFVFKKRERHKRPSKCPECKSEKITEPVFSVEV
ncbi:MAG: transcriptional regulator [Candidatus Woesearchaeota archaeon]